MNFDLDCVPDTTKQNAQEVRRWAVDTVVGVVVVVVVVVVVIVIAHTNDLSLSLPV